MHPVLRSLAKSPGFTLTALLTLALGIGVNTSMFSLLNAVMLSTPYADDSRLVRVYRTSPQSQAWPHSPANFEDHRAHNTAFERIAAVNWRGYNLAEPGQPASRVSGLTVSADFFPLLGVSPALGRWFTPEEDQPGRNQVVVLSHALWLARFGGDPAIVGREVRLSSTPVTVVGVMPAHFDHPQLWGRIDLWRPLALSDRQRQNRGSNYLTEIARLKPGVTLGQAQAAVHALAATLAREHTENVGNDLRLVPLARSTQDASGQMLTFFIAGLTGLVLLIACANLANLQFARQAARARELAICSALGASRGRLVRAILAESVVLGLAGGALGLLVALWTNDYLARHLLINGEPGLALPIDVRVLGFAFAASLATGVLFGLLPAWLASRSEVSDALKQGARGTTGSRAQHRVRHALIVAEVALALTLLAGAGFFVRGLQRFTQRDPGWRTEHVLTGWISLPSAKYSGAERQRTFVTQLHDRLAALPGVDRVAFTTQLPIEGLSNTGSFAVDRPTGATNAAIAAISHVTPEYFETLGIPVRAGRAFAETDGSSSPLVAIINETMAHALWPGENPIGRRIGDTDPANPAWRKIVGVVADVRAATDLWGPETRFQIYRPFAQAAGGDVALTVRSALAPEALVVAVRRTLADIDPDQPIHEVATAPQKIAEVLANFKLAGWQLASFALLGVVLAAVGIYGVVAGYVVQRTSEIGIRMALGAQVRDILALVLGRGLRFVLLGAVLGLFGAYAVARLLQSIMPELPAADMTTIAGVTGFLIGVATFACWLPARRATKVDPLVALRAE